MKLDDKIQIKNDEIADDHIYTGDFTPLRKDAFDKSDDDKIAIIQKHVKGIMETLGLDLSDDSLVAGVTCENDCDGFEDYTLTINVSANGNTMTLVDSDHPDETETFFRDNNVTTPPDGC
jgi:hypothetical protein